ncbi:hypothetical protein DL93DRAFT_2168223 [Clavulina sp. PMI_390]|nr:hypothetical protein DL93DRAFT_2168223 [Clavulina sp. PMI_390]
MFKPKRKRRDDDDDASSGDGQLLVENKAPKRRRPIETQMAALSLSPSPIPTSPVSSGGTAIVEVSAASLPSPVSPLEPPMQAVEQSLPEVQMKTPSWYEPEKDRIVVLDLDSSSESGSEDSNDVDELGGGGETEAKDFSISPTLLKKLRDVNRSTDIPKSAESSGLALVLFKPPPIVPPPAPSDSDDEPEIMTASTNEVLAATVIAPEGDADTAMELDP